MEDVDFVPIAARNLPLRLQSDSSSRLRRPVWRAASDTDIPATTVTEAIRMAAIRAIAIPAATILEAVTATARSAASPRTGARALQHRYAQRRAPDAAPVGCVLRAGAQLG